jgi:uncharacterized membrane protein YecN with MAPEG domain
MQITALYAGVLAGLFVVLSASVIRLRHKLQVPLGDGHDVLLQRRIRVQANFAEYVPLALLLLLIAEALATPRWLLHALGLTLVIGRILHALGVAEVREDLRLRVAGIGMSLAVVSTEALILLWQVWIRP